MMLRHDTHKENIKMTLTEQQYIEREVQLRVLKEMSNAKFMETNEKFSGIEMATGAKFSGIEKKLTRINTKLNWVLGINLAYIFWLIFLKVI